MTLDGSTQSYINILDDFQNTIHLCVMTLHTCIQLSRNIRSRWLPGLLLKRHSLMVITTLKFLL